MPEPQLPGSARARPDREPAADPLFWGDRTRRDGLRRPGRVDRPIDRPIERPGHRPMSRPVDRPMSRLADRLAMLRGDPRLGVVLLVVVAVVAGYVWYRAGSGSADAVPPPARVATTAVRTPDTTVPASSRKPSSRLVVHVAGRVTKPGVVELAAGSRVIDAVEAAGGGLPDADLDRLNLAARLADGQRVLVQKTGDPPAPAEPGTAGGSEPAAPGTGPIDLNNATAVQLEELPGIGPAYAAAIIELRDRRGGFKSVNELRDVRGIGEKRFAELKDLVTV